MILLLALLAASAAPAPAATPTPPTIVNERVYPICTNLHSNIGNAIQAVLADDQAIEAGKPLIVDMARNLGSGGVVTQNGLGNLRGPAALGDESAGSVLDTNRLERIIGTLQHNIDLIKKELSDPTRFPADPQTSSERQSLRLKGLLEDILKQQEALLNLYENLLDTRQTATTLAQKGDPLQQLFHIDTPDVEAKGSLTPLRPDSASGSHDSKFQNPKTDGANASFAGGALSPLPTELSDPALAKTGVSGFEKSAYAQFYKAIDFQQGKISWAESALALRIIITTRECNHVPGADRPR